MTVPLSGPAICWWASLFRVGECRSVGGGRRRIPSAKVAPRSGLRHGVDWSLPSGSTRLDADYRPRPTRRMGSISPSLWNGSATVRSRPFDRQTSSLATWLIGIPGSEIAGDDHLGLEPFETTWLH